MSYLVIGLVAFLASGLTFFSGFGLGTLLLPALALFFPVEQAIALTAIVHFLNGMLKLVLIGRRADRRVVLRFGLPAIGAAILGAWLLIWLSELGTSFQYTLLGQPRTIVPVKVMVGVLLLAFGLIEFTPRLRSLSFDPKYLPLGGVLSGFFGGLSGMQGALRSAFLSRAGLTKEAFIATGVVVACLIDISRLGLYLGSLRAVGPELDLWLLGVALGAAFLGTFLGNRYLTKMTMRGIQRLIAILMLLVSLALIAGVL